MQLRNYIKLDNNLSNTIEESASTIEKNIKDSLKQIHDQTYLIAKLTLSKISNVPVNDNEIKDTVDQLQPNSNKLIMFVDPQFWVAIAFIIFVVAVFNPIRKMLGTTLNSKIQDIKNSIEEAENIKNETQNTLSDFKKTPK